MSDVILQKTNKAMFQVNQESVNRRISELIVNRKVVTVPPKRSLRD